MKKLLFILLLTLGLATAANAKKLWECDVIVDGNITSDLIRYTGKVVEIWEDSTV